MTKATQDPAEPTGQAPASHDDDLIVAPKGQSRLLFFFTLGIMLFVLFIFTVGDSVVQSFSNEQTPGGEVYMTWTSPTTGKHELSRTDFLLEKRKLAPLRNNDFDDELMAYWLVLDRLAAEAGIGVTDEELGEAVLALFQGSQDQYDQFVRFQRGVTKKSFEEIYRRDLRVNRYVGMIYGAARIVDPTDIEKRWKGRHQEYRFQYVSQAVADMVEAARADVPEDAELETYYNALYDYQKDEYKLPAEVRGEVVTLSLEGTVEELSARAQTLLGRYPGEENADPDERARQYYEGFAYVRFRKENPDLSNIDPTKGIGPELFQKPYEEVEEQALAEAPLYDAFNAWTASVNERLTGGEAVDLAAEAAELGLDYVVTSERLSLDAWREQFPNLGRVAEQLAKFIETGTLSPAPVVGETTLAIGRPLDKVEEREPAFAEIRDQIAERWTEEHAAELASEKLDALRDEFGERPEPPQPFRPEATAEKFNEVATAAGFTVEVREWQDRFERPDEPTPAQEFFMASSNLFTLREDAVAEPGYDSGKTLAFMARIDGIRDPEVTNLDLNEVQSLQQSAMQEGLTGFGTRVFNSRAFMQERYGLWLELWGQEEATTESEAQGQTQGR